ncbi:hypothetical protein ABLO27_02620 [Roseibium sp. SCPC15]|uniref:hypothetical protein n=1 Tax=Roseibium sp. SCP15 TaxID=3141376 RepID=UPI003339C86A
MKTSKRKILQTATLAASLIVAINSATAATMDFRFSFTNSDLYGGNLVSGIVRGLQEGTSSATSVEIISNENGFGIGEFVGNPNINVWRVENGEVTFADFVSLGTVSQSPAVTCCTLALFYYSAFGEAEGVLGNTPHGVSTTSGDFGLKFTPIPLPSGGLLLISAFAGLAGVQRWKRASN